MWCILSDNLSAMNILDLCENVNSEEYKHNFYFQRYLYALVLWDAIYKAPRKSVSARVYNDSNKRRQENEIIEYVKSTIFDLPYDYEQLQLKCFKKDFLLQNNKFVEFAAEYYAAYGVKAVRGKGCFALYEEYDDCADVFYSAYADFSELKTLLLKSTNARRFVFTGKADNGLKNRKIRNDKIS